MEVKKTDGSFEEFIPEKIEKSICEAFSSVNDKCNEGLLKILSKNLFIYDKISTQEIRRQVEENLMSINKKAAKAYIQKYDDRKHLKKDEDFVKQYINASNASTGSKYDSNANVGNKNVVTLGQELHKGKNIQQNRYIMHNKIKALYSKKLADQYIKDLESHVLYKHDESGTPGYPYTYSSKEVVEVLYNGKNLMLPFDLLYQIVDEKEHLVDDENIVYQKVPWHLYVKDNEGKYTKVTKLTKKKRHRPLVRVKTAFGEDLVVTDNHPMITDINNIENTVEAKDSLGCTQYRVGDKLSFKGNDKIDFKDLLPSWVEIDETFIKYQQATLKRYIDVNRKLGYVIGFFVGDGNFNNTSKTLVFTQGEKTILEKLNNFIYDIFGITGKIQHSKGYNNEKYVLILSNLYVYELFRGYFKIQDKAQNKTLPYNILEFNEEFAKGCLEGLIDSDGTIKDNGSAISIRLASRACILQCTQLFRHFNYNVGNTKQSLPFGNNSSFKTNYTIWGISATKKVDSVLLNESEKVNKRLTDAKSNNLKYKNSGYVNITSVEEIEEESAFYDLNDFIYDITTETHTFSCNNILVHNCVAITMYPFLIDGLTKLGGQSTAPTDLKSYCGEFINLVYSISSQFMGAVATPEFLMYMDHFIRKDYGDDYLSKLDVKVDLSRKERTLEEVIENCFQQIVHSMNMPAGNRGYQSVFWNVGYFDKNYFDGVFGDFVFPDGTKPKWETLSWLQKKFMKWFNEERTKYILTFPVETMAMLTDGHDIVDKEYADFTSEMWAEGHSFFCYLSDSPDSLSSCCRLRNSLKDSNLDDEHNHTTHQFSMGTASVATGSKSVMTINLNRVIQDATRKYAKEVENVEIGDGTQFGVKKAVYKEKLYEYISNEITSLTERVHKYQRAFNEILKDFYNSNMLDVYSAGFISLKKQYLTVGVNGLTDAAEFLGLEANLNEEYNYFVNVILETINKSNKKDRTKECMYNTEFVPGENLSNKNYNWDKKDGYYVSPKHVMYSSYFFNPEDSSLSVLDKMKLHGENFVKYLDGGQAAHLNLNEHLSFNQYRELLKVASQNGCSYFTFNVKNSVCNDCGYISKDTLDTCPKCGSHNIDYLTRIIGYLSRVSSFAEARQVEEKMRYYS